MSARALLGSALAPLTLLALCPIAAATTSLPPADDLARVAAALGRGAFSEAVDELELWSDQGAIHADLSFDRGVAYLGRAESSARQRGDLGQAAAAFEEALLLDPDDEEAEIALERIRATISEQRAKREDAGIVARPRLLRALVGLVGENVWAVLAALGSLVVTAGLAARFAARAARVRLGGGIAAALGVCLLALGAGMTGAGWYLRTRYSPAVVIVEEARLVDAGGRPLSGGRSPSSMSEAGDRIPEAALVHVAEVRGSLARVEWGDAEAWVNTQQLRRIAHD